jgi:beta-N-acetylhexosaminidase
VLTDLLRDDLGFRRVVISDDLGAAAMADVDPAQRALRFLSAGGDLMIIGDSGLVAPMARAVRQRMSSDEAFAGRVQQSATRVVSLKARRGTGQLRRVGDRRSRCLRAEPVDAPFDRLREQRPTR